MRILFLSIADPGDFSSGGNQRSNYIRDALQQIAIVDTIVVKQDIASCVRDEWDGDRVMMVATAYSAGRREKLRQQGVARRMIAAADAANRYDFIVARYLRTAMLVSPTAHRRLVVDGDDLRQSGAGRSLARRVFVWIRAEVIRVAGRRMFTIWLVDPRDRVAVPGARVAMLPNTARRFAALNAGAAVAPGLDPGAPAGRRILMVGIYSYPPNEQGLTWFVRTILPRIVERFPDVAFHAIGRYHKPELDAIAGPVTMRGFVDDLATEYRRADVIVCPIMSGSGTQIKVVEALMNGRPTVVSDFAYQGFADVLIRDDHLLVARHADEWVRAIEAVFAEPDRFTAMAERGREAAEHAYSLDAFSRRVVDTFSCPPPI